MDSRVVANISYSKIESKSQQSHISLDDICSCCKYQLFKDRKQITTFGSHCSTIELLLQISVIQRSKANHNPFGNSRDGNWLLQISVIQRSKANHNNGLNLILFNLVVANISYSKIESKSQRISLWDQPPLRCCKYQLFKDRKQITTSLVQIHQGLRLLQISVIQRSKANHNRNHLPLSSTPVVANISYSKIESKSQHPNLSNHSGVSCCKYQLFKDRKQITTSCSIQ